MKRWVIFGAADIADYSSAAKRLTGDDFIVCADGGQKHLAPLGLDADLYLGDYDSSEKPDTDKETLLFPVEKDDTDMMLAIKEGLKRGCRSFLIFGGTGGRADHTFSNIQTLLYAEKHGASAALADERNFMFFLKNDTAYIEKNEGEKVSVFAFDPAVSGVTLEGFYYPLVNGTLYSHMPVGVSNYIVADRGKITVKKGTLLIIISKEG
ncbi:MAG: thiamine diphosphokinase [Clostridia bacterium]|nr:thiamine diphosphokinase [Clostridia bacterium]